MDEQALVCQIQEGNEAAFAEVVHIYKDRIVNYLYQITGDYQKAVELSQETFLRVFFKAHKYRPIAPFSSWIYAIASNLAKTELKKMRKFSPVSLNDVQNDLQASTPSLNSLDSGLIRNLRQALNSLNPRYRIPIILKDMEGYSQEEIAQILCGEWTTEKDKNGLYHYLLKIKFSSPQVLYDYREANRRGYYFKDGILGEILSILSIFFQCRFYLIASYSDGLKATSLKFKREYILNYFPCNPEIHPSIFSNKGKDFTKGLSEFFESIRSLNPVLHLKFILAFHHYARALKEIGKDPEMVFIRLVSSIEALSKDYNLRRKDDFLAGKNLNDIIRLDILKKLDRNQKDYLRNIFKNRKISKKFIRFIEKYSKGFFKGGNYRRRPTRILKKDLEKTLKTIYDARSKYVHEGKPMYLSLPVRGMSNWDIDSSLGMIIDRRRIPKNQKLPYPHIFERLVRHCLLNYLKDNKS